MKYKFKKKPSSMASLLDIILLVLFTQNIVSSQLVEEKFNKERETKIASYTAEIKALNNQIISDRDEIASYTYKIKELKNVVKSINNEKEKLNNQLEYKETKEKEKDAKIASISKELKEMKIQIKDYNNHMKTVTDYVNKYHKENNLEEYNTFEIKSMAKAFEEMSRIITVIKVRLTQKNIEITYENKESSKKEFIDWPQELEFNDKDFSPNSKKEVGSKIREKIKELVDRTNLKILLIWSYDQYAEGGPSYHQIDFFDELLNRDKTYIKDIDTIEELYSGRLGHVEKEVK